MPTIEVPVRRVSVVSSRPFDEIVGRLTATIDHPDMNAFHSAVAAATTIADLEELVQGAIGSSDLMEFVRFDAGEVLCKERGGQGPKILRLVVGSIWSRWTVRLTAFSVGRYVSSRTQEPSLWRSTWAEISLP